MRARGSAVAMALAMMFLMAVAPVSVYAQGAQAPMTGVVKGASGAVIPGVTVEVSSPALIERVRSGVTDRNGSYRVIDLPGRHRA